MSPGKETGAVLSAPKADRIAGGYAGCHHDATRTVILPAGFTHHAKEVCAACGEFLRWLPKPETLYARRLNAFTLAKLGMCKGLTSWERRFVHGMAQKRRLTPRGNSEWWMSSLQPTWGGFHHE